METFIDPKIDYMTLPTAPQTNNKIMPSYEELININKRQQIDNSLMYHKLIDIEREIKLLKDMINNLQHPKPLYYEKPNYNPKPFYDYEKPFYYDYEKPIYRSRSPKPFYGIVPKKSY